MLPGRPQPKKLLDAYAAAERALILDALMRCDGHRGRAAEYLGASLRWIHYRIRRDETLRAMIDSVEGGAHYTEWPERWATARPRLLLRFGPDGKIHFSLDVLS